MTCYVARVNFLVYRFSFESKKKFFWPVFLRIGIVFGDFNPNISHYLIVARLQKTPLASTFNR